MDAVPDRAKRYLSALERQTDGHYLNLISELLDDYYHFALVHDGKCRLLSTISDEIVGDMVESFGIVNLWAIANAIVAASSRPLFTLVVPTTFQ